MKAVECGSPALLLDIEAAERNIKKMSELFRGKKTKLRPHVKMHKSPFLAHKQISAGAIGIACAKVSEAEVMVQSGIQDILISGEVIGHAKCRRLARLARYSDITVVVENEMNAKELSTLASEAGTTLGILVNLNLGGEGGITGVKDRCGVPPGPSAVNLSHAVSRLSHLDFRGVMGYEGGLSKFPTLEQRTEIARKAYCLMIETKDLIEDSGLDVNVVSCGGTNTFSIAAEYPGITEVQPGTYIFMDVAYKTKYNPWLDFEYALSVLCTVISSPRADKLVIDAGLKTLSSDAGMPLVKGRPEMELFDMDVEHGHIRVKNSRNNLEVGDKLEIIPSDANTTVCLHDEYIVTRNGDVDMILKIAGRGKLQ